MLSFKKMEYIFSEILEKHGDETHTVTRHTRIVYALGNYYKFYVPQKSIIRCQKLFPCLKRQRAQKTSQEVREIQANPSQA